MEKNDAVPFTLLRVCGCQEKTDIKPQGSYRYSCEHEPWCQTACQWVKRAWCGIFEPVNHLLPYSKAIRNAIVVAKGEKNAASAKAAANNEKWDSAPSPALTEATAPAPKISTGT